MNRLFLLVVLAVSLSTSAFATGPGLRVNGTPIGTITDINLNPNTNYSFAYGILTINGHQGGLSGAVVTNTGSATLTAAQLAAGSIFYNTGTTATLTLDTGTNLSAALANVAVGTVVPIFFSNAGSGTVTLAGGTGTNLAYAITVPTLTSRQCYAVNTAANTWTIY